MSSFLTEAQRAALDAALAERLAAGGGASYGMLPLCLECWGGDLDVYTADQNVAARKDPGSAPAG
jgi:hypothetical protein